MDNKFPQTWEQAKLLCQKVETNPSSLVGLRRNFTTDYDKAAKLMAERYEAEIARLSMENAALQRFRIEDAASAIDDSNSMRKRYEQRIAELESAIREIDRCKILSDNSYFLALEQAMKLLK